MDHHVETGFDRTLNPWRGKGVVGNADDLFFPRDLRDRFQVDDFQKRIARRLDPNHSGIGFNRFFEVRRISQIDEGEIQIGRTAPDFFEKPERSAVKIVARDNMGAAVQGIEGGRHRGQSGSKGPSTRPAFQIGDAFFVS